MTLNRIDELEKEVKELTHRLLVLENPDHAKLFVCKDGHTHFMFDCSGCQYELDEYVSNLKQDLEAANSVLIPLMKRIMEKHLCPNCLIPMKREDEHTWSCECSPNAKLSMG